MLVGPLTDTPPPRGTLADSCLAPTDSRVTDGSLLQALRDGRPEAANALYSRYADRIRSLARAKLSRGVACRLDPDDIVQSVFRRFFHAARSGRYQLPSSEELWDLLLVITLNRLRSAEQHHRAGKRDLRQTVGWNDVIAAEPDGGRDEGVDAMLGLAVEEALQRLPDHFREVVRLRMEGYEVAEIAGLTNRSKRTVERMLQEARLKLRSLLQLES
jgi:RNA polymerase sigma-70 factor (ECF subfamily)